MRTLERPSIWRSSIGAVAVLLAGALAAPPGAGAAPPDASSPASVAVVVQGEAGAAAAADAVADLGGRVDQVLSLVDGVAAHVSPADAAGLSAAGFTVTPDTVLAPTGRRSDKGSNKPLEPAPAPAPAADADLKIPAVNPGPAWGASTGAGIGVALIDTGVDARHPDLQGRLELGPDLSGAAGEDAGVDSYGHGTFMAGLIAGNGSASAGAHQGVAPGAHVVSVKVAGRDGLTTLSKILGAIEWTVDHQDEYHIGVVNLSFGVVSPVSPLDPLVRAVDAAWASGLTVVTASGNDGETVTSPGWSPTVITVGATDMRGTATPTDDVVPEWSGRGRIRSLFKPDVLAPGTSVVSMRAAGSTVDPREPGSTDAYHSGSGTSMAAAMTSGAAAAYLAQHPDASPWAVKRAFLATSVAVGGSDAGALDLEASLAAGPAVSDRQLGMGRFPARPGTHPSFDRNGPDWNGTRWSGTRWSGTRWSGTRWSGTRWSGTRWSGTRWSDVEWNGTRWSGTRWSGTRWSGTRWSGTRWSGTRWSGAEWNGTRWSAVGWEPGTT